MDAGHNAPSSIFNDKIMLALFIIFVCLRPPLFGVCLCVWVSFHTFLVGRVKGIRGQWQFIDGFEMYESEVVDHINKFHRIGRTVKNQCFGHYFMPR